jgi:hypothetical protein
MSLCFYNLVYWNIKKNTKIRAPMSVLFTPRFNKQLKMKTLKGITTGVSPRVTV